MSSRKPIPIIIAGPSGVGKNAIAQELLAKFDDLEKLKTVTSRTPRDKNDAGYHFVSHEEFKSMIRAGEVLEWTKIHGNLYGSRMKDLKEIINRGKYPLALIDAHGVSVYKKHFPKILTIFIRYESLNNLPLRLKENRPGISDKEISVRLKTAQKEMQTIDEFEHVVVNKEGRMKETVQEISRIIRDQLQPKIRR